MIKWLQRTRRGETKENEGHGIGRLIKEKNRPEQAQKRGEGEKEGHRKEPTKEREKKRAG